ncbi:putative hydroxymethyltransferase [Hypoxylon cercidicola]|nr:putative hydroxymethyltransferase [Hypoxylon cercidicola]
MSQKIICNVKVDDTSEWYGKLVIDSISYEDESPVTIQQFLGVQFISPTVTSDIRVDLALNPWQETTLDVATEPGIDDETINVTARIIFGKPYVFQCSDTVGFEIDGNLRVNSETYKKSFKLYVDEIPSGTVKVDLLGEVETNKVAAGTYKVTAGDLTNSDETLVAAAQVSPSSMTVKVNETATVKVTYKPVDKFSALDVSIDQLSPPIDKEKLHFTVTDQNTKNPLGDFYSSGNSLKNLRRLPKSGIADISARIILNNVQYLVTKTTKLANKLIKVSIGPSNVVTSNEETTGFVTLPVKIITDLKNSSNVISVRLSSTKSHRIYSQEIPLNTASPQFNVKVAPGSYTVQATGFIAESTVYAIQVDSALTVASNSTSVLELKIRKGANLAVRGFPNFLSFGALSDLVDLEGTDLVAAKASSLFKYAGTDGAGDSGSYLDDDLSTTKTVQLAANVEKKLGEGHSVLPVLISYTINLSLGGIEKQLQDAEAHAHSFGNLILSLNLAKQHGKSDVPAGYVINPDFLGECQKGPSGKGYSPDYAMPVRKPLTDALAHRGVNASVPAEITDTLKGYVLAVNWIFHTVGKGVTFGWQVNLWGVGSSEWIYKDTSVADEARKTADYIKTLAVYDGQYAPDFLAVDRYEADDFAQRGYANGYCYSPYEWGRFFDFCGALSLEMQVPVMPWQIPASRIPNASEAVVDLEAEHWGSGGTYIFGDPEIGSHVANIHPKILGIKPAQLVGRTAVEDLFEHARPFDLGGPAYADFPLRGIFTVLLGGGATTGVVTTIGKTGPWTQRKMGAYMQSPVRFGTAS